MSNRICLFTLVLFLLCGNIALKAQETYYNRQDPAYYYLERLEIQSGNLLNNMFLDAGPVSRREAALYFDSSLLMHHAWGVGKTDRFLIDYMKADNLPYADSSGPSLSREPLLKYFYKTKANLYEVHSPDFNLFANPVLGFYGGRESGDHPGYVTRNTRGIELRGDIDKKVGFYSYLTDNQVIFPSYVRQFIDSTKAVPGEGYHKPFKKEGQDFFSSRSYITFSPTRHIHFQFGNDKHFIGSGYRSLLLSDFGPDFLSLKIRTRIWRFEYQNIFGQFINYINYLPKPYPKKYGAMHYLTFDAAKWLNLGLFEGVMFADSKREGRGFDFTYLNPVIFYRAAEHSLGSGDNSLIGANINVLPIRNFKIYGQLLLDEFRVHEVLSGRNWWGNKYGIQGGFKWINAFGLRWVDWQAEGNLIRPFTYSYDTSDKSYVHYNQALAHPDGANLVEFINILRFNPIGPLSIELRYVIMKQGLDSIGGRDLGSNLFIDYGKRTTEYGYSLLNGVMTTTQIAGIAASYQLRHNLFIDLDVFYRSKKNFLIDDKSLIVSAGLRLNFAKPVYDF